MKKRTLVSLTSLLLIFLSACASEQATKDQINTANVSITDEVQPDNVVETERLRYSQ